MPFFVVFGALSDRIGRKWIIMAGCLLAAVSYIPIYKAMQASAGSNVVTAISQRKPVDGRNQSHAPDGRGRRVTARRGSAALHDIRQPYSATRRRGN